MTLPSRLLSGLALAAVPMLIVGCQESSPNVVDGGTTVAKHDLGAQASKSAPEGRSFTDTSPVEAGPTSAELKVAESGAAPLAPGFGGAPPAELDASVTAGLDPRQAAGLRRDPGLFAKGKIEGLVTFADLSLTGVPLDGLLDYLFKPETEDAKNFKFPETVMEQEGKNKAIVGYMIALEYKPRTTDVLEFMLVKDLQACCYGGSPRPDEWINVRMKGDETTDYIMYRPIIVRGDLEVGRLEDDLGYSYGVYQMDADSVELYEPSKLK